MAQLPANARKFYKGLTLEESAEKAKADGRGPMAYETQATYLQTLHRLLTWSSHEGFIDLVPSTGINPLAKKVPDKAKRDPYSAGQLNDIFKAPLYTGCQDDELGFAKLGPNVVKRSRFWLPLIGLFTGMRLNEICQLDVADVTETKAGTWFFDVRAEAVDKSLKTEASKRRIPVHPELVNVGFLNYVEQTQKQGHAKLFPDLPSSSTGYVSDPFSKWYSRFLHKTIQKTNKTTFHSFRHNFRDALRTIHASGDVVDALGGWTGKKVTSDSYGSGLGPDHLKPYVDKIKYPGLDLSHLYE